jgi:hypothetical protein
VVIEDIKPMIVERPFSCTYSWVTDWINQHLKTLPSGSKVVELGTFVGGTTRLLAQANPHLEIHTIDLDQIYSTDNRGMINDIEKFYGVKNLRSDTLYQVQRMHLEDFSNIFQYTGHSTSIPVTNFHASFVDAHHGYGEVMDDLDFVWENTVDGGFIFGDDIDSPQVYNAVVHWAHKKGIEFTVFSKGFKIVKSTKPAPMINAPLQGFFKG